MSEAMISAPQPEAAEAGVEIMRAGGNAVDAAIGCALVQGVVDPMMCGLAGFGSMGVYFPARRRHEYIDFHAPAPLARTAGHVGEADPRRVARRLRLHPRRRRQRYRLPVDLRAGQPEGVLHRAARIRRAAVGRDRAAGDRLGRGGLDGAAARPVLLGRATPSLGSAPCPERLRYTPSAPRALLPPGRHAQARRRHGAQSAISAGVLRLVAAKAAPTCSTWARSPSAIAEDMRAKGGLISRDDLRLYQPRRNCRRSGATIAASSSPPTTRRAAGSCWSRC